MPLPHEAVAWACRILLDREPGAGDALLAELRECASIRELRERILSSAEYQQKNPDPAWTSERTLVIREIDDRLRLWIDLSDRAIGLNILRGRYELNELDFIRRTVRPGSHVVDCGAHIGFFAMHLAALVGPAGTVTAFEPFPPNVECLERSVFENRFGERVRVERAAVAATTGTGRIVLPPDSTSSGSAFLLRHGDAMPPGHPSLAVRTVSLDEAGLPRPIAFIKTDIEGAEPLAFRGAERILREDRPVILSELHPYLFDLVAGTTPAAFIAEMRSRGYRAHLLGAGVPGPEIDDSPSSGVTSVVFLPVD